MKKLLSFAFSLLLLATPAAAQIFNSGLQAVQLGNSQLTAAQLASAIGLSSCTRSSITTATGSGTNLTVAGVSGIIKIGDTVVTGTGIPAGTTIKSQTSGTPGGAGVYVTSVATTIAGVAASFGGIPPGATFVHLTAETANVRFRDDGGVPTTAIGDLIYFGAGGAIWYSGALSNLQFIAQSGSPLLDIGFYR
jgi:hypothetical protein